MKFRVAIIISCLTVQSTFPLADVSSRTVFVPRSLTDDLIKQDAVQQAHLHFSRPFTKPYFSPDQAFLGFGVSAFYQRSTNGLDIARYFLLGGKTELDVREDGTGDIASDWINLSSSTSNFAAKFSLKPWRRMAGYAFSYYNELFKIHDGIWISLFAPLVYVEHKLKITETAGQGGAASGSPATVIAAFNQNAWTYGKFNSQKMTAFGLDDLEARLGFNFFNKPHKQLGIYGLAHVPFGAGPSGVYNFEPLVGSPHWGLGGGLQGRLQFYEEGNRHCFLTAHLKYKYRFEAREVRSFDLRNGQWSRYLQLARFGAASTPINGINEFTRSLRVFPRSMVEACLGANVRNSSVSFEASYNVWWKDQERVRLVRDWNAQNENLGVFDLPTLGASGNTANANARIGLASFSNDGSFKVLEKSDLNLNSAAAPSALSHRVGAAMGLDYKFFKRSAVIGFGGSYEFAHNNGALSQWDVFLKHLISF